MHRPGYIISFRQNSKTAARRLAVFCLAGCLQIQLALGATTGIVVANSGGKTTPWFQEWQEFRRNIDEKSNGSILFDYLIFGETGNATSMEAALVSGRANIGGIGCQGIVSQMPELAIPLLPYLFQNDAEAEYVFEHKLTPLFSQILAQRGLVLLRWANFGWGDLYAREPVRLPYELAGRQVRTSSDLVGPAFLTRLKAEPSEITLSDLSGSMQNEKSVCRHWFIAGLRQPSAPRVQIYRENASFFFLRTNPGQ